MQEFMSSKGPFSLSKDSEITTGQTADRMAGGDRRGQVRNLPTVACLRFRGSLVTLIFILSAGCGGGPPPDEATIRLQSGAYKDGYSSTATIGSKLDPKILRKAAEEHYKPAYLDYFADMDMVGGEGNQDTKLRLDAEEVKGRNAWILWGGGNEAFWDWLSRNGYGSIDLLKLIDSNWRNRRFSRAGMISEPGMREPTSQETEDSFGIRFDRPILEHKDPKLVHVEYRKGKDSLGRDLLPPEYEVYGYPSGVVGLRLFRNPEFTGAAKARWDAKKYYTDPDYASRADTIRPYRVAMSCGFCHVAPHPLNPPSDPENPEWSQLSNNIGNQYMRFRTVFGGQLKSDNFLYHVLDAQVPGTIDTSLVAADNINNPNTVNSIYALAARLKRANYLTPETAGPDTLRFLRGTASDLKTDGPGAFENPHHVPRLLVDGSDSVGVFAGLSRVYLNIGVYHQQWIRLHNSLLGFRKQGVFKLEDCEENSVYWHATKIRIETIAKFLVKSSAPQRLKDAPNGLALGGLKGKGTAWDPSYKAGRRVFAASCVACHSSIQPGDDLDVELAIAGSKEKSLVPGLGEKPANGMSLSAEEKEKFLAPRAGLRLHNEDLIRLARGDGTLPPAYLEWAALAVETGPLFWANNYLSTDQRLPVSLIQTNSQRAMATNGLHGNMWDEFASETYKHLDGVGRIRYQDPFSGAVKSFEAAQGGRGYYRVPTLVSIWATAPFLHNNSLGTFNNKPSVEGRLEAFDDSIHRMLWPERRVAPTSQHIWVGEDAGGYYPDPMEALNANQRQLARDEGWIWRTTEESSLQFRNHHIPVLFAGATEWSSFWVALFPWLPSLALVLLGTLLVLNRTIVRIHQWEASLPFLGGIILTAQALIALVALILVVVSFYLIWKNQLVLEVLDFATESSISWLVLQAYLVPVTIFVAVAILFSLRKEPTGLFRRVVYVIAALCFLFAVVTAFSFGTFLAGNGSGIKFGPIPKGIPVNLLANLDPEAPPEKIRVALRALGRFVLDQRQFKSSPDAMLETFEQNVAPAFLEISKCPDLVTDRGHDYEFLRRLSDKEKSDLIDLLKTF